MIQEKLTKTGQAERHVPQGLEFLSLGFAVLIVLIIATLSYRSWQAFALESEEQAVSSRVERGAEELLSAIKDAETGQRGFLLTGQDRYLEPYRQALAKIDSELEALTNATARNRAEQQQRLQTLRPVLREKLDELQRTIELRRNEGAEAALAVVVTDRGKIAMDRIRQLCAEIQQAARTRMARYSDDARKSVNQIGAVSTLGSLALLALLLFSTIAIQNGTKRRQALIAQLASSEAQTAQARDLLQTTLLSIGDAVIATDAAGNVTFMNTVAETLTGWPQAEAAGSPLTQVFVICHEETRATVENPVVRCMREGRIVGLANHTVLLRRDGSEIPIEDSASPIRDATGGVFGAVVVFRDVTERRAGERALARSEERLELALTAGQIGVWDWDIARDRIEWSDMVYKIHGLERGEFSNKIGDYAKLVYPDDLDRVNAAIRSALEDNKSYDIEFRIVHPDGKVVWVATMASVFRDGNGVPVRMLGATTDVTARKQAEEHIRQQWHTFDTALSNTLDYIYIFDLQGRFLYANKALLSLVQLTLDQAIGKSFYDLNHPAERAERLKRQIAQVIGSKEPLRDNSPFTSPDGETRHYEYIFVPVIDSDGTVTAVAGSTRDITERNTAEVALRASEERLTLALEAGGGVGTWDWDIPNDRVYCNRQFALLFCLDPAAGTSGVPVAEFIAQIHPSDRSRVEESIRRAMENGGDLAEECRIVQPGDSLRWINARGRCHLNTSGDPVRFPGVIFETTDRRRAEEELRRTNTELTRANKELEEFAYVASHDLQEPLRMVNSYSQLLLRRFGEKKDPEMDQFAGFIRIGVRRMELLIRDLLNYSQTTHNLTEVVSGPVDINDALTLALTRVETRIQEMAAQVTSDVLPSVNGDLGQFAHVFQNILSNALKYAKPGVAARIHVGAEQRNLEWVISVKDNGIGFDQRHAERIFGLFKRLHREEQYAGTGLGLAICKRIIERHGGRIWAESQEGTGSTFYFALPVVSHE